MYQVLGYKKSGLGELLVSGTFEDCMNWMSQQCDTALYSKGYRRWELKAVKSRVYLSDDQVKSYWWRK